MRIRNGDFTERGLARILGISQPQIHNVLKGARRLQPEFADKILGKFDISILDLLEDGEISAEVATRQSKVNTQPFPPGAYIDTDRPVRRPPGSSLLDRLPRRQAS